MAEDNEIISREFSRMNMKSKLDFASFALIRG
jgi:hypothetical protein